MRPKIVKIIWQISSPLAIVMAFIPIVLSIFYGDINCDSAYFLCMVERISQGSLLYQDIHCGYTPLWFYMMAGLKWLFHISYGKYEVYLMIHYIIQILSAYFLYKIIRNLQIHKYIAFFSAWLFVMMTHWLQGNIILLEMPSMMFGLLSIWLILSLKDKLSWMYILIGILSSLSFLCKQFGFGFLLLSLYLIIFITKNKWQNILYFLVGYMIPIIICYAIWKNYFISIIFSEYGTKTAAEAGYDISITQKLKWILNNYKELFSRIAVILPISFLFLATIIKQNKIIEYIFCWCGIVGFMFQFYFVGGGFHYKLYTIPFVVIIIALLLSLNFSNKWLKLIIYIPIILMTMYSMYAVYNNRVRKLYMHPELKYSQYKLADEVKKQIKPNSTIWIVHGGIYYVYYLSNILPPNLSTIGYSFGPIGISEEKASKQISSANYVLSFTKDYDFESFYTPANKKIVWKHKCVYLSDAVVLHDMSELK